MPGPFIQHSDAGIDALADFVLVIFFMLDAYMLGMRGNNRIHTSFLADSEVPIVLCSFVMCTLFSLGEVGQLMVEGSHYFASLWNVVDALSLVLYWPISAAHLLLATGTIAGSASALAPVAALNGLLLWTNLLCARCSASPAYVFLAGAFLILALLQTMQGRLKAQRASSARSYRASMTCARLQRS